jgi:hypothetical protein
MRSQTRIHLENGAEYDLEFFLEQARLLILALPINEKTWRLHEMFDLSHVRVAAYRKRNGITG